MVFFYTVVYVIGIIDSRVSSHFHSYQMLSDVDSLVQIQFLNSLIEILNFV